MAKWADFGISTVKFDKAHSHIENVLIHALNGGAVGSAIEQARENIISAIKKTITFVTIVKNREGDWVKGQSVQVVKVNGAEYLRTTDDGKDADDLENLPEF